MKTAVAGMLLALASVTAPVTAHADCGDPNQPGCTGPVPTVDKVMAIVIYGDFSNYVITQRVGATVELIPHLFSLNNLRADRPKRVVDVVEIWR